ncbi:carboxylesterase [Flavobacterium album]|uniref:Carboxylic ester hydrolase n=1 Tax=Flavobacterium album TaxID=2175091 RepID=A0A2S1R098_9FLAO|nr:carboxylesterase family protein [Flavobacterium album]AWH85979.1 carboxylesterase [Flavobacterium album]
MKKIMIAIILSVTSLAFAQKAPQVQIEQGTIEGVLLSSGIQSYKGIPFAAPPVGELRWKAPQPPKSWTGVRKATEFGNRPMQKPIFSDMNFRSAKVSEDCLYLNIWLPEKKEKESEKLPVLVYFYGGGFVAGDASEYRYDGESLAKKGIITVTVNYRLGIFGFFSHPELTKESPNHASGNYGLLDQNVALLWVKKNIEAFGGDPNRITIAGESAGSISVSAQMASPLSKNLIAGAIGQSGAMIAPTERVVPLAEHEKIGAAFAEKIKKGSLARLRAMPADQLLEETSKWGVFNTEATIDGYFLKKSPVEVFAAGEQAKVPLLAGWTSAESSYMGFMEGQYPNPENYVARLKAVFGDKAEEVMKLYPGSTQEEVIASATALACDQFIVFGTWKWLDAHRRTSGQPVYAYIFSKARPTVPGEKAKDNMPPALPGANHSADIEYLLGNLTTNKVYKWRPDDYRVSQTGVDYFANFIKTGDPNGKGLPKWPVSKGEGEMSIMDISVQPKAHTEEHRERYLFLDGYFSGKK